MSTNASGRSWTQTRLRVAELTTLIDKLVAERSNLQAELDSIVYPVLTIPLEVTSNIFEQSIPEDSPHPSPENAPLLLTQICRQWRATALATPSLWQYIRLELPPWYYVGQNEGGERLLQMWLENSAKLPLSI
ncbi:hypothetical protein C8J57DRAFT_1062663, partial [Mycena rebaudengoi]